MTVTAAERGGAATRKRRSPLLKRDLSEQDALEETDNAYGFPCCCCCCCCDGGCKDDNCSCSGNTACL
jgi:hypothetical protein